MAKNDGNKKAKFGDSFGGFIFAVLCILTFRWLLFEPFVIPSGSMIPTLLIHDHILVSKMAYGVRLPFSSQWLVKTGEPKRGDIVVFRSVKEEGYYMIKRVIGLPGDVIDISPEGFVSINGEKLEEKPLPVTDEVESQKPYYQANETDLDGARATSFDFFEEKTGEKVHRMLLKKDFFRGSYPETMPYTVPADKYFVMGDNRDNSADSRFWGALPRENLLGRALFVWLSCEHTFEYLPFLCNPLELRWKRFGHVLH